MKYQMHLFYAPYGTNTSNKTWGWFKTSQEATKGTKTYARTWDDDFKMMA